MTTKSVIQAMQDFLAPRLGALDGKMDALNGRMDGLDAKLDAFRETMHAEIRRLDQGIESLQHEMQTRIDSVQHEMHTRFEGLEKRFDMAVTLHARLAALEAKVGHN